MSETPRLDYIAAARKLLRTAATDRLFAKAAQIITADGSVSGSPAADAGTLALLREELRRRDFGELTDAAIVQIAHQYPATVTGGSA